MQSFAYLVLSLLPAYESTLSVEPFGDLLLLQLNCCSLLCLCRGIGLIKQSLAKNLNIYSGSKLNMYAAGPDECLLR